MSKLLPIWCFGVILISLNLVDRILSCNEAVCASIVSKCMLTQSCKCDLKNCTCCRDCYNCLDELYFICCSCVEMCPKSNDTDIRLNQKSHIEDLSDPLPELFNVLTEEQDNQLRWVAFTYPAHQGVTFFHPKMDKEIKFVAVSSAQDRAKYDDDDEMAVNCTVVFMSQCMSWMKCKNSCVSMGASSYRWFHDGCCECVGSTCINYGMSESRCLKCPLHREEEEDLEDLDELEEEMDTEDEDKEKTTAETSPSDSDHEKEPSDITKVEKNEVSE